MQGLYPLAECSGSTPEYLDQNTKLFPEAEMRNVERPIFFNFSGFTLYDNWKYWKRRKSPGSTYLSLAKALNDWPACSFMALGISVT